jgi:uncharacterized secreted protein with C-terminal beta-propeller domain
MSPRKLVCVAAATALLAGCTANKTDDRPTPPKPFPASAIRLVAFDSCDQLTRDLRAAAKAAVGPWGFPGSGMAIDDVGAMESGARTSLDAAGANKAAPAAAPGTQDFSGTNTHEKDADEPDIIKTDGRRIVTVERGILRVIDPVSKRQTGRLDLGAEAVGENDVLLSGDRALVLVNVYGRGYAMDKRAYRAAPGGTRVLLVDLAGEPTVISRFEGSGSMVDARQTGSVARVVLRSQPRIVFPDQPNVMDEDKRVAANRKTIDKSDAADWLPSWSVTTGGVTDKGTIGCGQVSRPSEYSASAMLTVLTFDLAGDKLTSGDPVTVVADGDTVYGTGTSLYVANDQRWRLDVWRGRSNVAVKPQTEIFRFGLAGATRPTFEASGTVEGWLLNQYSMSEWDGHLRIATTDESARSSAVRVLKEQDRDLKQVGEVTGLGKGERIYSVRFIGPRGYVVTFKQTDPLYSLDLSDPAKPEVTGELKITGYSAHLQPAEDGRLIGIGQEADTRGRTQGTQVSYFDVSDPAKPRRLAQHHVTGGQSEAEWDPHALLYWPATKLLVVPVTADNGIDAAAPNGALAMRVTDSGIEQVGTVRQPSGDEFQRGYAPGIRRSLVIGDTLWTMSESGLQASDLSTLEQTGWVPTD